MAEMICDRSMWQTLTAAASTCALFLAANWSSADSVYENGQNPKHKIVHLILYVVVMPLHSLYNSMWNALSVWIVKSSLEELPMDRDSVAIITLCPLYIQGQVSLPEAGSGVQSEELERQCPLELRPRPDALGLHTTADSTPHYRCFELSISTFSDVNWDDLSQRVALLSVGLAPKDTELSFLRARNKFQSVVTALQAGGYLLSLFQRLLQRLAISPIEAIVCFLSIIAVLQLLIELYACGNYQRALLIRLEHDQYLRFRDAPRKVLNANIAQKLHMLNAFLFMLWLLISIICIYYFSHYVHTNHISAISALLFFLAETLLAFSLIVQSYLICDIDRIPFIMECCCVLFGSSVMMAMMCSWFLFGSSVIVAVVGTVVEWKAFHSPSHNSFAWIIPHLSS